MGNKSCNECARIKWGCTTYKSYIKDNNLKYSDVGSKADYVVVNDCCDFMFPSTPQFYSYGEKIITGNPIHTKAYISEKSLVNSIIEAKQKLQSYTGRDPNTLLISKDKLDLLEKSIINSLKDYKGIKVDMSKSEFLGLNIIIVEQSNYMKIAIV